MIPPQSPDHAQLPYQSALTFVPFSISLLSQISSTLTSYMLSTSALVPFLLAHVTTVDSFGQLPHNRQPSPNFIDVALYCQFISMTGMLNLEYSPGFLEFTSRFSWSNFVFAGEALDGAATKARGVEREVAGGSGTSVDATKSTSSAVVSETASATVAATATAESTPTPTTEASGAPSDGNSEQSSFKRRDSLHTYKISHIKRQNEEASPSSATVTSSTPTSSPTNWNITYTPLPSIFTTLTPKYVALDRYAQVAGIDPSNLFLVVLMGFLVVLAAAIGAYAVVWVVLEVYTSKSSKAFLPGWRKRTFQHGLGLLLHVYILAFFILAATSFRQIFLNEAPLTSALAGITIGMICLGVTFLATWRVLTIPSDLLFTDSSFLATLGPLYTLYADRSFRFFVVFALYRLVQASIVGLAWFNDWLQVILLVLAELGYLVALALEHPMRDQQADALQVGLACARVASVGLLFFFIGSIGTAPDTRMYAGWCAMVLHLLVFVAFVVMAGWDLAANVVKKVRKARKKRSLRAFASDVDAAATAAAAASTAGSGSPVSFPGSLLTGNRTMPAAGAGTLSRMSPGPGMFAAIGTAERPGSGTGSAMGGSDLTAAGSPSGTYHRPASLAASSTHERSVTPVDGRNTANPVSSNPTPLASAKPTTNLGSRVSRMFKNLIGGVVSSVGGVSSSRSAKGKVKGIDSMGASTRGGTVVEIVNGVVDYDLDGLNSFMSNPRPFKTANNKDHENVGGNPVRYSAATIQSDHSGTLLNGSHGGGSVSGTGNGGRTLTPIPPMLPMVGGTVANFGTLTAMAQRNGSNVSLAPSVSSTGSGADDWAIRTSSLQRGRAEGTSEYSSRPNSWIVATGGALPPHAIVGNGSIDRPASYTSPRAHYASSISSSYSGYSGASTANPSARNSVSSVAGVVGFISPTSYQSVQSPLVDPNMRHHGGGQHRHPAEEHHQPHHQQGSATTDTLLRAIITSAPVQFTATTAAPPSPSSLRNFRMPPHPPGYPSPYLPQYPQHPPTPPPHAPRIHTPPISTHMQMASGYFGGDLNGGPLGSVANQAPVPSPSSGPHSPGAHARAPAARGGAILTRPGTFGTINTEAGGAHAAGAVASGPLGGGDGGGHMMEGGDRMQRAGDPVILSPRPVSGSLQAAAPPGVIPYIGFSEPRKQEPLAAVASKDQGTGQDSSGGALKVVSDVEGGQEEGDDMELMSAVVENLQRRSLTWTPDADGDEST
ncbi:hypothetical protein HK102_013781 [Quaeritorhiza haematococci]|nr:hypothetical protein HK102_013781 [Quaeritorhiza haematococci]